MNIFKGAFTALITPMNADGSVDFDGFRKNVKYQLEEGIDGLVPLGTTAETPTLDEKPGSEEDKIIEILKVKWDHLESWTSSKVKKLTPLVNEIVSGCNVTDPDIIMLLSYIAQIEYYLNQIKVTVIQMNDLANKLPIYNLIHSLPGIQDILTCKFIAELGDISRFTNYKQIVAYAGIDPMIRQSGDKDGLHLKMSKKGNKRLRTILHLMVSSLIKANREIGRAHV